MKSLDPGWRHWPQTQALVDAFGAGQLRFVGGAVRDALLGRPVTDVDAATPLPPQQVMALLEKAGIKAIPTGLAHGTVTAVIGKKHFEITTLRRDIKTDGRHAEVAFTNDWKEDAQRRDFTMNALYLSPEGELFDYGSGQEDAAHGRVRFIGDASARIKEDYLRILRFFRFHAHYGIGKPDDEALAACRAHAGGIAGLSAERVAHEMLNLIVAKHAHLSLALMKECGIHPGVTLHTQRLAALEAVETAVFATPSPLRRLAALVALIEIDAVCKAWRLSGDVKKQLRILLASLPPKGKKLSLAEQKALLRQIGAPAFMDVAMLMAAQNGAGDVSPCTAMIELAHGWIPPEFPLSGEDLKKRGMKEGKAMGQELARLEALWEQSDYMLSKDELMVKFKM